MSRKIALIIFLLGLAILAGSQYAFHEFPSPGTFFASLVGHFVGVVILLVGVTRLL